MATPSLGPQPRWMLRRRPSRSAAARDSRSSSGEELIVMFGAMMTEIRPSALPCQASANSTACRSWAWRSAGS